MSAIPEWVSDVEPGSTHDISTPPRPVPGRRARTADPDREGLHRRRHRHHGPTKGPNRAPDNRTRNQLISAVRAPAERANSLLKRTWRALECITLDPWPIGAITAALVLIHLHRPTR